MTVTSGGSPLAWSRRRARAELRRGRTLPPARRTVSGAGVGSTAVQEGRRLSRESQRPLWPHKAALPMVSRQVWRTCQRLFEANLPATSDSRWQVRLSLAGSPQGSRAVSTLVVNLSRAASQPRPRRLVLITRVADRRGRMSILRPFRATDLFGFNNMCGPRLEPPLGPAAS